MAKIAWQLKGQDVHLYIALVPKSATFAHTGMTLSILLNNENANIFLNHK